MTTDQLISLTELKHNSSKIFKSLLNGPKFILSKNRMQAVILSPSEYRHIQEQLRAKERDNEVGETLEHGKGYSNVDDLFLDLNK